MRFQKICSTSALLLLASAGSAFAADTVASASHDGAVGDSSVGAAPKAALPCKPTADVTAKDGKTDGAVAGKPCVVPDNGEIRLAQTATSTHAATVAQTAPAPQDVPQAGAPAGQPAEEPAEVVVTGSRIARKDFVSNQPIVSVSATELATAGKTKV